MTRRRGRSALVRTAGAPRAITLDGHWVNPTTGVGGPQDKSAGFTYVGGLDALYSPYIFTEMYEQEPYIAKIVDMLVNEAMRRGFKVETDVEDPKSKERIQDHFDRLKVKTRFTEGCKWGRLHGGAATLIGSADTQQWMPLKPGAQILHLTNFERDELNPARYYDDPLSDKFGEPSHYRLSPSSSGGSSRSGMLVHESRLIRWYGVLTTRTKQTMNQGWGSSVLLRCIKAISQYQGALASALASLANANQDVFKVKDLAKMIKAGQSDLLREKLRVLDEFRSAVRAIAVDADGEDFVRSSLALTGVSDIIEMAMLNLSAASESPITRLFGRAPAGLNATGESDERMFQANAQVQQTDVFNPALTYLTRLIFRDPSGPTSGIEPSTWSIQWPSLWEPTALEAAQIDLANMQTDSGNIDKGIYKASDAAKARFRGEGNGRILLSDERINELVEAEGGGADDAVITATPGAPNQIAAIGTTVETTDEDDEESYRTESAAELAEQLTEFGAERCVDHGAPNRCRLCGVERKRGVTRDGQGNLVTVVAWRPIKRPKAKALTPDAAASQPAIAATAGAPNAIAPAGSQSPNG
jgi:uncharacterized protein